MKASESSHRLSRRVLFAGAGVAGAAAVATALPIAQRHTGAEPEASRPAPEKGGGYALTEHVKRYYKTARV